jgi:hypothetical protein
MAKRKMKIMLVNPPNCGRSIPEEEYGITSIKQIFRGEPFNLEVLAAPLADEEVTIFDLKCAGEEAFWKGLDEFLPDIVGFTSLTCEANTVIRLAAGVRQRINSIIVIGAIMLLMLRNILTAPNSIILSSDWAKRVSGT